MQYRLVNVPINSGIDAVTSCKNLVNIGRVTLEFKMVQCNLPLWLSGLAISGRGAVKPWLAIRQGVGSYPTPAGMLSQVYA